MENNNSNDVQERIKELQMLEHNLHAIVSQKQNFQVELNEATNAQEEVSNSKGDVFKMVSGIMIKVDREQTLKSLGEKIRMLEMKVSSVEKQQNLLEKKADELRKLITSKMK